MVISNKFLNAADVALQGQVAKRLFRELNIVCPERYSAEQEAQALTEIAAARKACVQLGIVTEKGVFTWLALQELLGNDFFLGQAWINYKNASGKIGDYAINTLMDEVNDLLGVGTVVDNGFGLPEAALALLQPAASAACTKILEQGKIAEWVGAESGRLFFLEVVPTAIVKNPYDARIAALNAQLKKNNEMIRTTGARLQELLNQKLNLEVENYELMAAADGEQSEDVAAKRASNEEKLQQLQVKINAEKEKTREPLHQLTEKNKTIKQSVEVLKAQRGQVVK